MIFFFFLSRFRVLKNFAIPVIFWWLGLSFELLGTVNPILTIKHVSNIVNVVEGAFFRVEL